MYFTSVQFVCCFGLCLTVNPVLSYAEDALQGLQGSKRSIVDRIDQESFNYTVLTLDQPISLQVADERLHGTTNLSPLSVVRSVAAKLNHLNIEGVKEIKKLHASDDVTQSVPDTTLLRILSQTPPEKREDWKITQAILFGDILFIKAHYKNRDSGKEELDIWPLMKTSDRWQMVLGNAKFKAGRGPQFQRALFEGRLTLK